MKPNTKTKTRTINLDRCAEIDDLMGVALKQFETGKELAKVAEVSPSTIYRYKNKPVFRPGFPTMRQIAWAAGFSYQLVSRKNVTRLRRKP